MQLYAVAVRDYPLLCETIRPQVIEAWAPLPITQAAVEEVIANPEDEVRFVAEREGHIIGVAWDWQSHYIKLKV
jgi:putative acetyltransferase